MLRLSDETWCFYQHALFNMHSHTYVHPTCKVFLHRAKAHFKPSKADVSGLHVILVLLRLLFSLHVCGVALNSALRIDARLSDIGSDEEYIHSVELHDAMHRNVRRGTRAKRCSVSVICGDTLAPAFQSSSITAGEITCRLQATCFSDRNLLIDLQLEIHFTRCLSR